MVRRCKSLRSELPETVGGRHTCLELADADAKWFYAAVDAAVDAAPRELGERRPRCGTRCVRADFYRVPRAQLHARRSRRAP